MITVGKITLPCIIDIIIITMTKRHFLVHLHKSDGHLKNLISDINIRYWDKQYLLYFLRKVRLWVKEVKD